MPESPLSQRPPFRRLRLQLSLLYPLVGLAVVVLLAGGAYAVIHYYLLVEYYPDLLLEARMAEEYNRLELALPEELERQSERAAETLDETTLGVPVSILFLNEDGQVLRAAGEVSGQVLARGVEGARQRGRDLRTAHMPDDTQVRFLTYRLPQGAGVPGTAYLQIGRRLTSQDLLISQLSITVLVLGVFAAALTGLFSWWLAGRSVLPAQRAWEHQQQFIANAGHELRTPITLIRANAEVALRPATREARRIELLADIVEECDHVSRLVEDLLLLSRLDAGKLSLAKEPVPAGAMIAEVAQQFQTLAEQRGVRLAAMPSAGVVTGDRTRLRQVLMILLDNAIKFTPPGGTVRLLARQATGGQVEFEVEDSGPGIAPADLPHVFERFYQAGGASADSAAGIGLGLPIARALVEAQGGTIQLRSQPGQGACVTLRFPGSAGL